MAYANKLPELERLHAQRVILRWKALQDWIKELRKQFQNQGLPSTSWLLTNDRGDQLARDPLDLETLFENYAHRDYFHGMRRDLDKKEALSAKPIKSPHLSHVFMSKAAHQPVVAFSVPIHVRVKVKDDAGNEKDEAVITGVLGMTVEFGDFSELLVEFGGSESQQDKSKAIITSLIDSREDFVGKRGGLLEHPLLRRLREEQRAPDRRYYVNDEIRHEVKLLTQPEDDSPPSKQQLGGKKVMDDYEDPVSRPNDDGSVDDVAREFDGPWMAAMKPVVVNGRQTGWVVVVQERQTDALRPTSDLRQELGRQATVAVIVVTLTLAAIWGLAWLTMQGHTRSKFVNALRRRVGLTGGRGTTSATAGSGRTARRPGKTPTSRSAGR